MYCIVTSSTLMVIWSEIKLVQFTSSWSWLAISSSNEAVFRRVYRIKASSYHQNHQITSRSSSKRVVSTYYLLYWFDTNEVNNCDLIADFFLKFLRGCCLIITIIMGDRNSAKPGYYVIHFAFFSCVLIIYIGLLHCSTEQILQYLILLHWWVGD